MSTNPFEPPKEVPSSVGTSDADAKGSRGLIGITLLLAAIWLFLVLGLPLIYVLFGNP